MAHYAVGDIQGCYDPLVALLDKVNFDQSSDTLYCVGDLVNRGPKSLKTIRLLKSLGNQCVSVLGNHDIHLLAMMYGVREHRPHDTLKKIIEAPDAQEIADWLRNLPLLYTNDSRKFLMCHAGLYPWWTLKQAKKFALDVEETFKNEAQCVKLLKRIYNNSPSKWTSGLGNIRQQRFTINAFTRMRFCSPKGHLNFSESGFKGKISNNRIPWFMIPNESTMEYRIIFGHWSAVGLLNTPTHLGLDTGFIWGKEMTMAKIPKNPCKRVTLFSQPYD
jgi:bis(5'-nucleosyl)-tetraphosphatase (symmetrical)